MMYGSGSQDYNERNSVKINLGEELFLEWAKSKCTFISRLGFDEKNRNVDLFYNLNPILRNIPDFVILNNHRIFLVNVKGTTNIKRKEIELLPKIIEAYSSEKAPLVYAFCFRGNEPVFMNTEKLFKMYEESQDKVWDDGVIYRTIKIE
jgi:hypothetical protein